MDRSFPIATGLRQRSHYPVRFPRDSLPYFTVSDSRLLQPAGPDPRIYIPQEWGGPVVPPSVSQSQSQSHIATDGRSVSQ
jgi:hypothetical protein